MHDRQDIPLDPHPYACAAGVGAGAGVAIDQLNPYRDELEEFGGDAFDLLVPGDEERDAHSVALDTNALIGALDAGHLDRVVKAMAGRAPVVSPTVEREYLVKGSRTRLLLFLGAHGGRIGLDGTSAGADHLQSAASMRGRSLGRADAFIAHAAMSEGIALMTNDRQLSGFLRAIAYRVEGW
jgi:predicted nucleic acid-binding protein